MPPSKDSRESLTPPVLNNILKLFLPRLAKEAETDPDGVVALLSRLEERLRVEVAINPGLAAPRCPGFLIPEGDSRISPMFRNDVMVCAEVVCAMIQSIKTTALDGDDTRTTGIAQPSPPACPSDLVQQINDICGTPIDSEEGMQYCRRYLLGKGTNHNTEAWELMLGRLMAWEVHLRVGGYDYNSRMVCSDVETAEYERLSRIITAAARVCSFERKKDLYLTQILRTKLFVERIALLAWGEPPMRQIPAQYGPGDETNQLVRPFIDISPEDRIVSINYKKDRRIDSFVFTVAILQETLDNDNIRLFCNTEITFSESDGVAQPFVACSNFTTIPAGFGVVQNKVLSVISDASEYPICAVLLDLIRRRVESVSPDDPSVASFRHLLQCCEEEHPPASNPFLRYLETPV